MRFGRRGRNDIEAPKMLVEDVRGDEAVYIMEEEDGGHVGAASMRR